MQPSAEPTPTLKPRMLDLRLFVAVLLLIVAAAGTWRTIDTLRERRDLRMELAEVSHVRYGLLSFDQWVGTLVPILESRIDSLQLTKADRESLRPMVESALNRLLDEVKDKMSAKPEPGKPALPGQGNAMLANMLVNALRPHVGEFSTTVIAELSKPETIDAAKGYMKRAIADGMKQTFAHVDMRWHKAILDKYGASDAEVCKHTIQARIAILDTRVTRDYLAVLASSVIAFLLLLTRRGTLSRAATVVLLLFCIVLLAGGVLTPMIDVEARLAHVGITFLGQSLNFEDQVIYYQSKSVLEVFRTLIDVGRPEMWLVGVLVLMFSVIFPVLKILTLTVGLFYPRLVKENPVAHFLALESSKWSMADVMALAIFMCYVAFNGVLTSSLGILRQSGAQLVIPTDGSKILPGYYLFIAFCLASLFLSKRLERNFR